MATEDITFSVEKILCPVCQLTLTPPASTCKNGHVTCGLCTSQLLSCPTCTGSFTKEEDKFVNRLLESIPLPCKYRSKGCDVNLCYKKRQAHEDQCNFTLTKCLMPECPDPNVVLLTYDRHLRDNHNSSLNKIMLNIEHYVSTVDMSQQSFDSVRLVCDFAQSNTIFVERTVLDMATKQFFVCVYYIGEILNALKFTYRVRVEIGEDIEFQDFMQTSYCLPYMESVSETMKHYGCYIIDPKKIFLPSYDTAYRCYVKIQKL